MLKTAVIGAGGYIGRHLWQAYGNLGTTHRPAEGLVTLDVRQPDMAALKLVENGVQSVILAAAKPLIGYCEKEPAASREVNVTGTLEAVRQLEAMKLQTIWFSSDYVFDGRLGGYTDDAQPSPGTEYGRQKAEVERAIPQLTDNYLILRLSKTYGTLRGDRTLLDEMAALLMSGGEVTAASDQLFSPTHIDDVVGAVQALQARGARGLYNLSCGEDWSRFQIAQALARALNVQASRVRSIQLHDLASMAGRPLNTTLRSDRLQRDQEWTFKSLQSSIQDVTEQWRKA